MAGIIYWANTNGIGIYTAVFFVNLAIEEMVKTKFNPGGSVEIYESAESGISPLVVILITTQKLKKISGGKKRKLNHKGQEPRRRHFR